MVRGRSTSATPQTNNLGFVLQVVNDGPTPISLHDLELRYWFKPGSLDPTRKITQQIEIDYAAVGASNVKGYIDPPDQHGLATLRLQFADAAGSVKPYTSSGDIAVRLHKSDWSAYDQSGNFSFRSNTSLTNWDRVALYRAGVLVWGAEPHPAAPEPRAKT
jgi:cellulose binding protein with CBM3 domain